MSTRPNPALPWPVTYAAVDEIAFSECSDNGPDLVAFLCPAGVPTIGWGETEGVSLGDTCTPEQADQWLLEDLIERTRQVQALCKVPTSANELGALVSLAYNVGVKPLAVSTVLRAHNAGDRQAASRAFDLWNKATVNGRLVVLDGLTARRKREGALYLRPAPGQRQQQPMPQAVEAESKLTASPINVAGAVAAVSGAGTLATSLSDPLKQIKATAIDVLGIPADWFLPLVLVGVGLAVIWWRVRQRREGWA